MIEAPAHDALALRLVLREPTADACAAAFVSGLSWPAGTDRTRAELVWGGGERPGRGR